MTTVQETENPPRARDIHGHTPAMGAAWATSCPSCKTRNKQDPESGSFSTCSARRKKLPLSLKLGGNGVTTVQQTENPPKARATSVATSRPPAGTDVRRSVDGPGKGVLTLIRIARRAIGPTPMHPFDRQKLAAPGRWSPQASYTGRNMERRILCGYI